MVGGVAYHAGKRRQEGQQREYEQEARIQDLEAQQAPMAAAPAGGGGMSPAAMDQLKQLADLRTQGILTDAEFEVQKQKILQGM
jgi:hypothetical protein